MKEKSQKENAGWISPFGTNKILMKRETEGIRERSCPQIALSQMKKMIDCTGSEGRNTSETSPN
jgi:hypothetical protein